jgi:guanylate kinase
MHNKLLLLCAPSGTGKSTVARMLIITDKRFKYVKVLTTRIIRPDEGGEKINVSLEELREMNTKGELVNFNEKDGTYYGIRYTSIDELLKQGLFPVLEWDINRLNFWDDKFPVYKIILEPMSIGVVLENLKDGRDLDGKRRSGVIQETENIKSGIFHGDKKIVNFEGTLFDTVQKIRDEILK